MKKCIVSLCLSVLVLSACSFTTVVQDPPEKKLEKLEPMDQKYMDFLAKTEKSAMAKEGKLQGYRIVSASSDNLAPPIPPAGLGFLPEPTCSNTNIGDGITIRVLGNYCDLVQFLRNGSPLLFDPIRDGNHLFIDTDITYKQAKRADRSRWNVAVRHGRLRDLVFCYAIVDNQIYKSPLFRDDRPRNNSASVTWLEDSNGELNLVSIDNGYRYFFFDKTTKTWHLYVRRP